MPLRDLAEEHQRRLARERLRGGAMRIVDLNAFRDAREVWGYGDAGGRRGCLQDAREMRGERLCRRGDVRSRVEEVLVRRGIQERDGRAVRVQVDAEARLAVVGRQLECDAIEHCR